MFRIYKVKNQINNCSIYHSDLQNKAGRSHCYNNTKFRWLYSKTTRSRYTTQKKMLSITIHVMKQYIYIAGWTKL